MIQRLLTALALSLVSAAALAENPDRAIALLDGGGIYRSHLDERSYTGLTYDWSLPAEWSAQFPWGLSGWGEANLSTWRGCTGRDCGRLTDVGIAPVFRSTTLLSATGDWYAEASVGVHLISVTRIADQVYSTAFQFGEFVGLGCRFGDGGRYEIGLRDMHESNGNLKFPNNGMNFLLLRLAFRW